MLITVNCDTEEMHHALERVKKCGEHCWREMLLRWSPTARGVFNSVLHPVVFLLILMPMCLLPAGANEELMDELEGEREEWAEEG